MAVVLTVLAGLALTAVGFREAVRSERKAYDSEMRGAVDNRFSALRREIDALLAALEQARLLTGPHEDARQNLLAEYRSLVSPGGIINGVEWVEAAQCGAPQGAVHALCPVATEARDNGVVTLGPVAPVPSARAGTGRLAAAIPFYRGDAPPEGVSQRRLRYTGSVVVLVSPREILEQGMSYLQPAGVHVLYYGDDESGRRRVLALHRSRQGGAAPRPFQPAELRRAWQAGGLSMEMHGIPARPWSLAHASWHSWALLLVGLITTSISAAYVSWMHSRARRISEVIHRRTVRLRAASRAAKAASRAKSQFLANISHEIRTPIGGIVGMSEMLLSGGAQFHREAVDSIHSSARQLIHLVNNILDYSKFEAGHFGSTPVEFQPAQLLREIACTFTPQARLIGLRLLTECDPRLPRTVRADENHIRQILYNLVTNALRFTSEGEVCVAALVVPSPRGVPTMQFSVRDTGIGIAPQDQARIFEAFVQADSSDTRRFGGTGLGLAISKQLAEGMGGELGVESEPGRGSRFWVSVPFQSVQEARPPATETGRALPHEGRRLLLVEDNPLNQLVLRRLLERLGCSVEIACNGLVALDYCQGSAYDAILMDCQMPELDGYDTTRAIRALPDPIRNTPILGVTASTGASDRDRCLEAGMDEHLPKPVTLDGLQRALEQFCATPAPLSGTSTVPPPPDAASR
ncbi:MAG: response regulator [Bryobacterales bacterium]|nr:response regulator [Bryobacterales bacterium]